MLALCIFSVLLCRTPAAVISSFIVQDSGVRQAVVGQTVTLHCSCKSDIATFYTWYQQKLGGKPLKIATRMRKSEASLIDEYRDRFQVVGGKGFNNLTVSGLLHSDSAMYYCGVMEFNAIEFGPGVFLHVRTSQPDPDLSAVYQPELVQLPLGHSLNLSCNTRAIDCKEEHSVFWFRESTGKPTIMYHNVGHCVKESSSGTRNCTFNFSIKSVNSSDAGMYVCALASCGGIMFGRGTLVQFTGDSSKVTYLLCGLIAALAIAVTLLLALAFVLYKIKSRKSCPICKGTASHTLTSSGTTDQDENALNYAALSLKKVNEHHCQKEAEESTCVYSRVRSRKE